MEIDLEGKVALVTGGAQGIGKGCAIQLAKHGANLIINDLPNNKAIYETVKEIKQLGKKCNIIESDVFTREGCETLVNKAVKLYDRIDILVSNPAKKVRSSFLDYDPSDFRKTINGTLISGFDMGQLVAKHMVKEEIEGKIIFISSIHASRPYSDNIAYNAAKAGLNQMAKSMAVELAKYKINVNLIEPGWIDTPNERRDLGDELVESGGAKLPLRRIGKIEDIGMAAVFLSSNGADYITGENLTVDGLFRFRDCIQER